MRAYGNICGTLVLSSVDGGTEYVDDAFNAVTIDYTVSKDAPLGDAPLFLNKTPCFNLLDLLTSELRHIAGDTYKVYFEKVLTFMLRSYFGLKVDKISENPMF